jgi:DNA-binding NarL/FixJ family response regulator
VDAQSNSPKRVLVVENHQFFRENLINWIATQAGLHCCAEATTVAAAKTAVLTHSPDLILLDLTLDDISGLDLLQWLNGQATAPFVIVLSQYEEQRYAETALNAGARGYVSKAAATEDLQPAIEAVLEGMCYVSGSGKFPCRG